MHDHEEKALKLAEERTLLAAERTFSAWLRTAMAAMAAGFTILRITIFKSIYHRIGAHIMGELLIIWGCSIILLAAIDYKRTSNALRNVRTFKSTMVGFLLLTLPLLAIATLLLWVMMPYSKSPLVYKEIRSSVLAEK